MHSAAWDNTFDYEDKRVSVIGCGSSAVQIVPSMLPDVKYMDHYVRGQAWISPAGFVAADPRNHLQGSSHQVIYLYAIKIVTRDTVGVKLLASLSLH